MTTRKKLSGSKVPDYSNVGKAVKRARELKGLTVWDLAKNIGEQYNTVKRIEEGHAFLLHHLRWIKEVLGVDALTILNGEGSHGESKAKSKKQNKREIKVEDLI